MSNNDGQLTRWLALVNAKLTYLLEQQCPNYVNDPRYIELRQAGEEVAINPVSGILTPKDTVVPTVIDPLVQAFLPKPKNNTLAPPTLEELAQQLELDDGDPNS
jgi:hypothetical protein